MSINKSRSPVRLIALVFLSFQVLAVVVGLFTREKHFNWVPYDELSDYEIKVTIADTLLSNQSIRQRYRRPAQHRENRSIHNLIALVRRYETTYGRKDQAAVIINYQTNGHATYSWAWPEDLIIARDTASPPP